MKTSLILSCCLSLWMISCSVDFCRAQNSPYQGYQRQSQPPLQNPASAPVSSGGSSPARVPAAAADSGASKSSGGQEDPDLLDTFDKYLLNNLEQLYYLLSYAFKDATKKTFDKCGCTTRRGSQATTP